MLCRKKPSPVRRKLRRFITVLLAILILLTIYVELSVKHQLRDVIIRDMQTLSEQAVTMAVDDFLEEHADTGNRMCDITYNNGSVAAISTNAAFVNAAKTYITEHAQDCIDRLSRKQGISVRLGNFTGLVFLSNFGPEIPFSVDSTQTVSCEFQSSFTSAGVNQTVHHITVTVYVDLLIYGPIRIGETVSTESTFEIAQTVIVGTVPSYSGVISY